VAPSLRLHQAARAAHAELGPTDPADEQASLEQFRALRGQILRDVALGLRPDLVFVDHEPLGSSSEFRDGLWP